MTKGSNHACSNTRKYFFASVSRPRVEATFNRVYDKSDRVWPQQGNQDLIEDLYNISNARKYSFLRM